MKSHIAFKKNYVVVLLLVLLFFANQKIFAVTKTYTKTSGTWAWAGYWGGDPGSSDACVISPTANLTITAVPGGTYQSLTISASNYTVTLQSASGVIITITSSSSPALLINSNLTLGSSVSINCNSTGLSATLNIAASKTLAVGTNSFTFSGGSVVNNTSNSITNSSGGTVTFNYSGSGQAIPRGTYAGTLIFGGSAPKSWQGYTSTAISGTLQFINTASTSGSYGPSVSSSTIIEYAGSSAQTIQAADWSSSSTPILKINNSSGVLLSSGSSSRTVANLNLNSGKLSLGNYNLTTTTITGGTASNYVVSDGTGILTINAVGSSSTLFPIGPSTTSYTPLTLASTTGTPNISTKVSSSITNAPTDATKVVNLEWSVLGNTAQTSTITFQWNTGNQASSFSATATCDLGNYTSSYAALNVNTPSGSSPYTVQRAGLSIPASGTNLYVVGNTGIFVSCTAPATQARDIVFSNINANGMTLTWTNGSGSNRIVKINTSNSFTNPSDGTTYTGNATYSGSGEQIVYAGSSNTVNVSNLSGGTTYYFKVFEYNCSSPLYQTSDGATNNPNSQITNAACTAPASQASNITFATVDATSGTISWVIGNGSNRVVYINTTNSFTAPTNGVSPTANTVWSGSGTQCVYNSSGNSVTVTGLTQGITYYAKVYEYDCSGILYCTNTGTNNSNSFSVFVCSYPSTQASSFVGNGYNTGMIVNWTKGNGAKRVVYINTSNTFTAPVDGNILTANSVYGGSGQQCVYNGAGSTVDVTGLTASTAYYYAIYEYSLTGPCYKTSPLTGSAATTAANPTYHITDAGSTSYSGNFNPNANSTIYICNGAGATLSTDVPLNTTYNSKSYSQKWQTSPDGVNNWFTNSSYPYPWTDTYIRSCDSYLGMSSSDIINVTPWVHIVHSTVSSVQAPTNCSYSAGFTSNSSSFTANWTPSVTTDNTGGGLTVKHKLGYSLDPTLSSGVTWVDVSGLTTYTITGITPGKTYYWEILAQTYNTNTNSYDTYENNYDWFCGAQTYGTCLITLCAVPTNVSISPTNPAAICSPATQLLTATVTGGTTPFTYQWYNGSSPVGTNNSTFAASASGTYTCVLTNACTSSALTSNQATITINNNPTASISGTLSYCSGSSTTLTASGNTIGTYTYNWNPASANASITASGAAQTYYVTVTDGNGCKGTTNATTTVNTNPTASISGTLSYCSGSSTTLTASGNTIGTYTYNWNPASTNASITASGAAQTYYVTVTDGNGCKGTTNALITVNSLPIAGITNNTGTTILTCLTSTISVTGTGGGTYSWSGGTTPVTAANSFNSIGTYTVTVTGGNGCTNTSTIIITQDIAAPAATASFTAPVCTNGSLNLTGGPDGMTSYTWSGPNSFSSSSQSPGISNPTSSSDGIYYLTVTAENGCQGTANTATVTTNSAPSVPEINGLTTVCPNDNNEPYSVASITDGSYTWAVTGTGNSITGVSNSPDITVSFGSVTGNVNVTVTNACGYANNSITITVTSALTSPLAIAASSVQSNQFTANWNAVTNASRYTIDVSTNSGFPSFAGVYHDYDAGTG